MIQITYISSESRPLAQEDLEDILKKSRKNNVELGVTGMLLYGNKTFIQVLEGENKTVDTLITKIKKDPRHTDFRLVSRKEIQERQYSGWNMGFKKVSSNDFEGVEGVEGLSENNFNTSFLANHASLVDVLLGHYRQERIRKIRNEELSLDEEDPLIVVLHRTIRAAVKVLSVLMVFVILWGVVDSFKSILQHLIFPGMESLTINHIVSTFGSFLAVLIAIEIFINITLYIRRDVIHIKLVIATALMAIARKVIIFDYDKITSLFIFGTAAVILALGITYWLIEKDEPTARRRYMEA